MEKQIKRAPYIFLSPFLVLFGLTILVPIVISLAFSFMDIRGESFTFVGLDNFKALFNDPMFLKSYVNVLIIMIGTIPFFILLALLFAVLLNNPTIKGKGIFRTVYYLPAVTSLVAVASVFMTFYNPLGILNTLLGMINIDPIPWLSDPFWGRIAMFIVIIWQNVGYYTILFLGGLQGIPSEVYESADMDGASPFVRFFYITVPMLKPIVLLSTVLATINGLNTFEIPNILYGNTFGPGGIAQTVGVNLYKISFEMIDFGKASAIAWSMVFVAAIISLVQFKVGKKYE
ncbi:lactose/L-arabinose transport system permease protein [Enterococcus sp. PF1-24]|uniref:carbohydrate ABC transporter permease n=1 Tax=unclassified Enterococcus TaxID=2608891 RepID=UPI0024755DCB|nr:MULTISPECIES: sugar ABC transporter permease [unclassified Enterococcus]MDH6363430.1 lactose/L-arabinose transport system permease protein [Enterococcus sp. PFB1-1]MDH6400524.1 lactose/L-arabinose transport system permease protein [Enterococcus sp. PF1-24]